MARKPRSWDELSPQQRKRFTGQGVTREMYETSTPQQRAKWRGHKFSTGAKESIRQKQSEEEGREEKRIIYIGPQPRYVKDYRGARIPQPEEVIRQIRKMRTEDVIFSVNELGYGGHAGKFNMPHMFEQKDYLIKFFEDLIRDRESVRNPDAWEYSQMEKLGVRKQAINRLKVESNVPLYEWSMTELFANQLNKQVDAFYLVTGFAVEEV